MAKSMLSAQKMTEIRKRQDEKYREMDAMMAQDRKVFQMANFEITTTNKIERRLRNDQYNELKRSDEMKLYNRRQELAELFNSEMEMWKQDVLSRVETLEDRKMRIKERAYALKEAREKERQEYVTACYNAQWRDACDDARNLDSKAMTQFMHKERISQMELNKVKQQQEEEQEREFLKTLQQQSDVLATRDRQKLEDRHAKEMKNKAYIQKQIEDRERMKDEYYEKMREEDTKEIQEIRASIQEDAEEQYRRKMEEHRRGREVLAFNEQYKLNRQYEKEEQHLQDSLLLDYALRKERDAIQAEENKKKASRMAALQFKRYLEEQMVKEKEDSAAIDEIRRREEEKVWKQRDDALQQREDARNYLMKLVDQGRQEQISLRKEQLVREKEGDRVFASRFLDQAREGVELERREVEKRRQEAHENSIKLKEQIGQRERQRELERQEVFLEDKHMQHMERAHQRRLAEQGGTLQLFHPLKQSQWYS